jgi:hypothetical protein
LTNAGQPDDETAFTDYDLLSQTQFLTGFGEAVIWAG